MEPGLHIIDRCTDSFFRLEQYLDDHQLRQTFKPEGKWGRRVGKVVSEWMVKGIRPNAFQGRVRSALKFEDDHESPDKVQRVILKIASEIRKEDRNRVLDSSLEKKPDRGGESRRQPGKPAEGSTTKAKQREPGEKSDEAAGNFQGRCFVCKRQGHRANRCPDRVNGSGNGQEEPRSQQKPQVKLETSQQGGPKQKPWRADEGKETRGSGQRL